MSRFDTLIQPHELASHLEDERWVLLDCRFDLANPSAGEAAFAAGHIPGAQYAHLDRDLSSPITSTSGRHPLPPAAQLAARLADWGVGNDSQVVAYDAANSAYASRAWWLLRWLGHMDVAVLDGGLAAWKKAGLPIQTEVRTRARRPFVAKPRDAAWLSTAAVAQTVGTGEVALIDARGADRFAGQNETLDPVAGHVPGARNHPFPTNLDAENRFLPASQLRSRWSQTLAGAPSAQAVLMCGSGVTACHNLLALEIAGLAGGRLYAGSWSEWIRDPSRPVAK